MRSTRAMTFDRVGLVVLLALAAWGCGGGDGPFSDIGIGDPGEGPICRPDPSVEPEDCYLNTSGGSGVAAVAEPEGVREVCNSPCTKVKNLYISVEGLENLKAFSRLETVEKSITISGNPQLKTLSGLEVEGTPEWITIERNPQLSSVDGLDGITYVDNTIKIKDNEMLTSLSGLHNLETMGSEGNTGGVMLVRNGLKSLSGLEALTLQGGLFKLMSNPELKTTKALNDLGTIGSLTIRTNDKLRDLKGFADLEDMTWGMEVKHNPKLPACVAEDLQEKFEDGFDHRALNIVADNGGYDHPECEGSGSEDSS